MTGQIEADTAGRGRDQEGVTAAAQGQRRGPGLGNREDLEPAGHGAQARPRTEGPAGNEHLA